MLKELLRAFCGAFGPSGPSRPPFGVSGLNFPAGGQHKDWSHYSLRIFLSYRHTRGGFQHPLTTSSQSQLHPMEDVGSLWSSALLAQLFPGRDPHRVAVLLDLLIISGNILGHSKQF